MQPARQRAGRIEFRSHFTRAVVRTGAAAVVAIRGARIPHTIGESLHSPFGSKAMGGGGGEDRDTLNSTKSDHFHPGTNRSRFRGLVSG